ncbi:MAG TPA: CpaE family protein [Beijerinckiaceae bacterium]|jgi:pilus assembly protein CpaE
MNVRNQGGLGLADDTIAPIPRVTIQGFCESQETAGVIGAAAQDRRMMKAHVKVHMGGASAAVEAYRNAPTPNVIVLEASGDRDAILHQLDELAEFCDAGTKVIVIGRFNDIILYRELIARGVSDYLVSPLSVINFVRAVSQLYAGGSATTLGRIVAVTGAKGGVGASTIAHNISWALSRNYDAATVLADLDLPFGTAGLDFNQDPAQGIGDAVFTPERLDQAVLDRLISRCSDKLSLLAAPVTLDRMYDLGEAAFDPICDLLRASVPHVVLDVPHGWASWTRRTLMSADEIVIVAAPDLANLRNVKNLLDVLRAGRPNDAPPRLVINMVGVPKRPEIGIPDFVKVAEIEPMAVIPFDAKLFGTAANNGQMIAEVDSGSKVAEALSEITRGLTGRGETRQSKKGLLGQLGPLGSLLSRARAS